MLLFSPCCHVAVNIIDPILDPHPLVYSIFFVSLLFFLLHFLEPFLLLSFVISLVLLQLNFNCRV